MRKISNIVWIILCVICSDFQDVVLCLQFLWYRIAITHSNFSFHLYEYKYIGCWKEVLYVHKVDVVEYRKKHTFMYMMWSPIISLLNRKNLFCGNQGISISAVCIVFRHINIFSLSLSLFLFFIFAIFVT